MFARFSLGAAFLAYLVSTALLYFWGPWNYPMPGGSGRLIVFLVAVHLAFAVGYFVGVRGRPRAARVNLPVEKLVLAAVAIDLALLFPTSELYTGHWIPNPWAATGDLGAVYRETLVRRDSITPYVNYVRILLSPLLALAVPLGVFYWPRMLPITKVLFTASVAGTLALYVAMGTNVAAGDWMALFPWFVLASHLAGVHPLRPKGWAKAAGIQVLSIVLFAVLFSAAMNQRAGSYAKWGTLGSIARLEQSRARPSTPSPAHPRAEPAPSTPSPAHPRAEPARSPPGPAPRSAAKVGADGLAAYVTQGYYAVYLGLQEPFVPCYGVGNSTFLRRQAARLTGNDWFLRCPYPVRIQDRGWNASGYWATIYPWIASDVTFPGTVVVILLIAWLAGRVWLDVLSGRNPFAVALLGQLLLMLYFFPGHNRVLHIGEGVVAFSVFLAAWLLTRQRTLCP